MLKYLRILPVFAFELFFKKINLFIVLAMVNLHCCTWAFLSCREQGLLCYCDQASHGSGFLLQSMDSKACRLQQMKIVDSEVSACRLQSAGQLWSYGAQVQLLQSMWNLPGPGIELMSLALQGRFLTTELPGKPCIWALMDNFSIFINTFYISSSDSSILNCFWYESLNNAAI